MRYFSLGYFLLAMLLNPAIAQQQAFEESEPGLAAPPIQVPNTVPELLALRSSVAKEELNFVKQCVAEGTASHFETLDPLRRVWIAGDAKARDRATKIAQAEAFLKGLALVEEALKAINDEGHLGPVLMNQHRLRYDRLNAELHLAYLKSNGSPSPAIQKLSAALHQAAQDDCKELEQRWMDRNVTPYEHFESLQRKWISAQIAALDSATKRSAAKEQLAEAKRWESKIEYEAELGSPGGSYDLLTLAKFLRFDAEVQLWRLQHEATGRSAAELNKLLSERHVWAQKHRGSSLERRQLNRNEGKSNGRIEQRLLNATLEWSTDPAEKELILQGAAGIATDYVVGVQAMAEIGERGGDLSSLLFARYRQVEAHLRLAQYREMLR